MTQPGGGSFAVDSARAPKAIRELEDARRELESIKQDAQVLGQVNPPARDQVSLDAALVLGRLAVGGPGALIPALDQGIREIGNMIEALRSGFENYRGGDEDASSQLRHAT
jgi:hypothetical protein